MKEELCFPQLWPGKVFPDTPLSSQRSAHLLRLVLEEAPSRGFIVFVILIEAN